MRPRMWWYAGVTGFAAIGALLPARADAQVEVRSRAIQINLTGRLHAQFNHTSVAGEPGSEFLIRRARFTADVRINDFVSGRVQPDYGEGEITLKDAYVRLAFTPAFRATVGQFKRPFDIFELTSSTQILVVERAGGVRGVDTCSGPGGICSFSRFTEKLQYSDRDIGVLIDGQLPSAPVGYAVSVTNGTGANTADENGGKSYTGRLSVEATDGIVLAANVGLHDYLDGASTETAVAFGGDLEIGDFNEGLHVQAGFVSGDNWQNLGASGPSTFMSAQGIVTFKVPVQDNRFVAAVEPVGRVSWGDPDTDVSDDEGLLFTPGFVVHFVGRNKIGINADIWSPSAGDSEFSLKVQTYLHF